MRHLRGGPDAGPTPRAPLTLLPKRRRKAGAPLLLSGLLHGAMLLLLLTLASLGLLNSVDTEQTVVNPTPDPAGLPDEPWTWRWRWRRWLEDAGPASAGRAQGAEGRAQTQEPGAAGQEGRRAAAGRDAAANADAGRDTGTIPKVEQPPPTATPEPPRFMPPQAVQAPVVPQPADKVDAPGTIGPAPPSTSSNGPGTGGGVGSGSGAGVGEGRGGGIGAGWGGGTGGGPYQPGSGVAPPVLLKEVRPGYTDEARRRSIEGDVLLEIVVRQDGSVGNVRVTRSLGAGLEQKAIDAVRQWRFGPARRQGQPVDVVVEVSVEFKLR